eukprot:TRINITY_DN43411_c0_g1_i1.p1 TRINITY_DN43411_c0_g1~~TRINITY_DN43411_c0_g1_i1.p1  ORF type:complete len:643 (-),score=78.14 TRINITY_DN43411_c0_g1_i1:245-2173(-)
MNAMRCATPCCTVARYFPEAWRRPLTARPRAWPRRHAVAAPGLQQIFLYNDHTWTLMERRKFAEGRWKRMVSGVLVAATLRQLRDSLTPSARIFLCAVSGVVASAAGSTLEFERSLYRDRARRPWQERMMRLGTTISNHFGGVEIVERSVTHPRFVLRNTLSISFAFFLGWSGVWNVLPSYSSYAASTISVVVYTYTGSSMRVSIGRVAGIVMGKVLGTMLQLYFGTKEFFKVCGYVGSMFAVIALMFFFYLHGDGEISYVCCLTAGFVASSMVPPDAQMREAHTINISQTLTSTGLVNSLFCTVMGVCILTLVDLVLASKASNHAQRRLLRSFGSLQHYVGALAEQTRSSRSLRADSKVFAELDELQKVIPYAENEYGLHLDGRRSFRGELYRTLERRLRRTTVVVSNIAWSIEMWRRRPADEPSGRSHASDEPHVPTGQPIDGLVETLQILSRKVTHLKDLAPSASHSKADEQAAKALHRELRETVYTAAALHYVAHGTGTAVQRLASRLSTVRAPILARRSESEEGAAAASSDRLRKRLSTVTDPLQKFVEKVVHENLGDSFQGSSAVMSFGGGRGQSISAIPSILKDMIDGAKELEPAGRRRALAPNLDAVCLVELMVAQVSSAVEEAQAIELAILEY